MKSLFPQFPKVRAVLPKAYQDIYEKEYKINRNGESIVTKLSMKLESWLHKKIASSTIQVNDKQSILEIGAGTLNHIKWEENYNRYDIIEPFGELYKNSPDCDKVSAIYNSIYEIPSNTTYDRIISIAVLEHVLDLPQLIATSGLLLDENGIFQASIPSQGSLAWYVTYNITTGLAYYLRNKLNYNVLMNYEHVNTYTEIEDVVNYFYSEVSVSRFPVPFKNTSLYSYISAKKAQKDRCRQYLQESLGCQE